MCGQDSLWLQQATMRMFLRWALWDGSLVKVVCKERNLNVSFVSQAHGRKQMHIPYCGYRCSLC